MPRTRVKQQFVKASGTMQEIVQAIAHEVYSLGGDDDDLRQILDEDGLMKQAMAKQVMALAVPPHSWFGATFQVKPEGRSREELVAAGEYSKVAGWIRSRSVSPPARYERIVGLLCFERTPTLEQVNRACTRADACVANMSDLEVFGADYSGALPPGSYLIALGGLREFAGAMYVGCLSISLQSSGQRELTSISLEAVAHLPNEDCHYLTVESEGQ